MTRSCSAILRALVRFVVVPAAFFVVARGPAVELVVTDAFLVRVAGALAADFALAAPARVDVVAGGFVAAVDRVVLPAAGADFLTGAALVDCFAGEAFVVVVFAGVAFAVVFFAEAWVAAFAVDFFAGAALVAAFAVDFFAGAAFVAAFFAAAAFVAVFFAAAALVAVFGAGAAFFAEGAAVVVLVPAFFTGEAVPDEAFVAVLLAVAGFVAVFAAGAAFPAAPVVLLAVARWAAVVAAAVFFAAIRPSVAQAVDADKWG